MKILRGIGGVLLISAGAFCGMYAYAMGGGSHGWGEFRADRMFQRGAAFAIGCPCILLAGVRLANAGSRLGFWLGALLAFAATGVALGMAPAHRIEQALPAMAGAFALAVAGAFTSALGRKSAVGVPQDGCRT